MERRLALLAVHGHPDDETMHIGGTLARYAAEGVRVACVTATRGELGRIVDRAMSTPENHRRLGEIRVAEMARALESLGPIEWRWLGYRDSGVPGDAHNDDADAFCRVDPDEAAGRVARVIREVMPQVVITHNEAGDDGHPDHIAAARAARLAFDRAGDPEAWPEQLADSDLRPWTPLKLYETYAQLDRREKVRRLVSQGGYVAAVPVVLRAVARWRPWRERLRTRVAAGQTTATTRIDVRPWLAARDAAIRVYRTQIAPDDPILGLTPEEQARVMPEEAYALRASRVPVAVPESDLFAGVRSQLTAGGVPPEPVARP